jgi:uncharacterized surface protein with fasciclin (FAS1) repeats
MTRTNLTTTLFAAALIGTSAGITAVALADHHKSAKKDKQPDIVDTAKEAGQFSTLLAAADAAGLVDTLKGDGPLTVMAPTDAAFDKLPEGTVETLLKPENQEKLVAILTYHVIAGKIKAADALEAGEAKTVEGGTLEFKTKKSYGETKAMVNGVKIVKTNIMASNGVIHVIDEVLMPKSKSTASSDAASSY